MTLLGIFPSKFIDYESENHFFSIIFPVFLYAMLRMLNVNIFSLSLLWKVCTAHKATFIKSFNQGETNCVFIVKCHAFANRRCFTKDKNRQNGSASVQIILNDASVSIKTYKKYSLKPFIWSNFTHSQVHRIMTESRTCLSWGDSMSSFESRICIFKKA